jgi:uncharacterized repeat protein (TIGR01451 family)
VLTQGVWKHGKEIFDMFDTDEAGDWILKGAYALDVRTRQADEMISHLLFGKKGKSAMRRAKRHRSKEQPVGRTPFLETLESRQLLSVAGPASVWTNMQDYAPGASARIGGSGFAPGETVQLQVRHAEGTRGSNADPQNQPWLVTDGGEGDLDGLVNGCIQTLWLVNDPDAAGATYQLTARGLTSGKTALATFTDAPNPPPVQTFFLPFPAASVLQSLQTLHPAGPVSPVSTYASIAMPAEGTYIYYDQWENGFVNDISNPTVAEVYNSITNPGGVQIWGDGDVSNGAAPGYPTDVLHAGNVIILSSPSIPVPRVATQIFFDGGDKIGASKSVAIGLTSWASGSSTLFADALEVYDTNAWGTQYTVPLGQNTSGASGMFAYTGLTIMAAKDATTVQIDLDGNGTVDVTQTLNQGQAYLVNNGVQQGATVTSTNSAKPVQVGIITGDPSQSYSSRWFTLEPRNHWSNNYFTPVSTRSADQTVVFLYNPSTSAITVSEDTRGSAGTAATLTTTTLSVPAGGTAAVTIPEGSGAHFYTTGGQLFYGFSTTDFGDPGYDWGMTLVPASHLTTQAIIGLGFGRDPTSVINPSENGSPVFVTPVGNGDTAVTVYVDYNGDNITNSGPTLTDPNGFHYDVALSLRELQRAKVFDPDGNQSGMLLYTVNPNVKLVVAWGEDPSAASAGEPGVDVGTSVVPLPEFDAGKDATLGIDANFDGVISPGDTLLYTIVINNASRGSITDIILTDTLPAGLSYIANSTSYTLTPRGGSPSAPVSVLDAGTTPFPLDEGGVSVVTLAGGVTYTLTFQAKLPDTLPSAVDTFINTGTASSLSLNETIPLRAETQVFAAPDLSVTKTDGVTAVVPGQTMTYTVTVTNSGGQDATNVVVTDTLDPNAVSVLNILDTDGGTLVGNQITWNLPSLAAGSSVSFTLQVSVDGTVAAGISQFTDSVSVTDDGTNGADPTPGNNSASDTDTLNVPQGTPDSISGQKFLDVTGNGLTSDDTPLGGFTIRLFADRNGDGRFTRFDRRVVFATDVTDSGTGDYLFSGLPAGRYFVEEVTPSNYVRTAPTTLTYYTVDLVSGGQVTGINFDNFPTDKCQVTNVHYIINGTKRFTRLQGHTHSGDLVEVQFTVPNGVVEELSLVSYTAPTPKYNGERANEQVVFDQDTGTFTAGTYTMAITLPNSYYQVDFVCGPVIDHFGPNGSNIFYTQEGRLLGTDYGGKIPVFANGSRLSGAVYVDGNNDGVRQPAEPGIEYVLVRLTGTDNLGQNVNLTRLTKPDGLYTFDNLLPGVYTITEVQPGGYVDGKDSLGTLGGTLGNDSLSNITVPALALGINYNFGEQL